MSCFQALPVNFGVLKSRAEHNSISIWGFQSGPRARLDLRMFSRLNGEHRDHPFQELWFGLARLRATGATLVRPETCSFRGKCVATGFAVLWIWDRKAGTIATDASSDKAKLNPKVGILQISGSTGGVFWIDWVQIDLTNVDLTGGSWTERTGIILELLPVGGDDSPFEPSDVTALLVGVVRYCLLDIGWHWIM